MTDPLWEVTTPTGASVSDPTPPGGVVLVTRRASRRRLAVGRLLLAVGVLLVGYYLVTLLQVWSTGRADDRSPVDAIVVLGAAQYDGRPSPQLEARLDHALALYQDGVAPVLFVTGGKQPGDRFTEADASRQYLVERGVGDMAIVDEHRGSTTWESLQGVATRLTEMGKVRVVIVTDPFHSLRSRLMAEELGLDAGTSATRTSPVRGGRALWHHLQEAGGVALGRVIGFDRFERLFG